jgi:rhomboid family GlyGly-CTERM serine protease
MIRARWTAGVAVLSVAATVVAVTSAAVIDWVLADATGVSRGEWWRLLTGPLVHAGPAHLFIDVGVLLAVGLLYEPRLPRAWPWLIGAGLVIPTAVVMAAIPDLQRYYGISGLTHSLLAAAVALEMFDPRRRLWAGLFGAALLGKVVWELAATAAVAPLAAGVEPVPLVHLVGLAVGAIGVGLGYQPTPSSNDANGWSRDCGTASSGAWRK